jgi:hypothetical protein
MFLDCFHSLNQRSDRKVALHLHKIRVDRTTLIYWHVSGKTRANDEAIIEHKTHATNFIKE